MISSPYHKTLTETPKVQDSVNEQGKRSPDSIVAMNATSSFDVQNLPLLDDKVGPIHRCGNDFNLPPLHTPHTKKSVRLVDPSKLTPSQFSPSLTKKKTTPVLETRSYSTSEYDKRRQGETKNVKLSKDTNVNGRRSIFGQYWNKDRCSSTSNTNDAISRKFGNSNLVTAPEVSVDLRRRCGATTPPITNRKRSSASAILGAVPPSPTENFQQFAPPKEYDSPICSRFASVDDISLVSMAQSLPPLPTPLRRLCSECNRSRALGGMYPLVTPVPILRQSSYRSLGNNVDSCSTSSTSSSDDKSSGNSVSFNLTRSFRMMNSEEFSLMRMESSGTSSVESTNHGVHFDPRVTVTEFEDNVERQWYSDYELELCKHETVALAQEYLLAHPQEFDRYNRRVWDPITETLRKKPLYSLPVLASVVDSSLPNASDPEYRLLVQAQVQNILVVDPNIAIANLFCKSLHQIFPHARFAIAQSGDVALQLINGQLDKSSAGGTFKTYRNFDIILVERRLYTLPKTKNSRPLGLSKANSLTFVLDNRINNPNGIRKPNSFNTGDTLNDRKVPHGPNMSGSDLIRAICAIEDDVFSGKSLSTSSSSSPTPSEASSISSQFKWRSLIIGVSAQPDRDAKTLRDSGADVIWGKPMPRIGDPLRNQLMSMIISKRRRSTTSA